MRPSPVRIRVTANQVEDVVITDVIKFEKSQGSQPPALFIDKATAAGQTYYYRVQARNSAGVTDWSNVQKLTRP